MMSLTMLILGGLCVSLVAALLVAVLVVWMQNRQESASNRDEGGLRDSLPLPGAGAPNLPRFEPAEAVKGDLAPFEAEARALVREGKKLEAIKVYRQATGVGLAEAKQAVEALERGERPNPQAEAAATSDVVRTDEERMRELIGAGNKLEAIKVYHQLTGSDLMTAKNAVEAMEREMKSSRGERS